MILVVESGTAQVDRLDESLRREGFDVDSEPDAVSGFARALEPGVELVVLELNASEPSCTDVLGALERKTHGAPVIVVSASGEVDTRVSILDAGAIDYLIKPFSVSELGARIRAQLQSASRGMTAIQVGGVHVDLLSRQVSADGAAVRVSPTEFELLVYLMRNSSRILTRDQILRTVWGYTHDPCTNVVDVYVGQLRRKLHAAGGPPVIVTIRGRGYRFEARRT